VRWKSEVCQPRGLPAQASLQVRTGAQADDRACCCCVTGAVCLTCRARWRCMCYAISAAWLRWGPGMAQLWHLLRCPAHSARSAQRGARPRTAGAPKPSLGGTRHVLCMRIFVRRPPRGRPGAPKPSMRPDSVSKRRCASAALEPPPAPAHYCRRRSFSASASSRRLCAYVAWLCANCSTQDVRKWAIMRNTMQPHADAPPTTGT